MKKFSWIIYCQENAVAQSLFSLVESIEISPDWQYCLQFDGIVCVEPDRVGMYLPALSSYKIAYADFNQQIRQNAGANPLLKAIGKQRSRILDMTAGWGQDALNMAQNGSQVIGLEDNEIMAFILNYAKNKLQNADLRRKLDFIHTDAGQWLQGYHGEKFDAIYIDPMYPEKKKTAAAKKPMYFLQYLHQNKQLATTNEIELLNLAKRHARYRVVVKRPHIAPPILPNRVGYAASKLLRFDIYAPQQD